MIDILLIYIVFIALIGVISIFLLKYNRLFFYVAAPLLSLSSFAVLIYTLYNFTKLTLSESLYHTFLWSFPFAQFTAGVDSLSLFFAIPMLILVVACSLYGTQYFRGHHPGALHWFNYAMLIAGMLMVLCARNGILFIIAWEIMSFASFMLVITDSDKKDVIRAGWIYFVTAHVGTAFLLLTFFMLAAPVNSFEFSAFATAHYSSLQSNLIFIFAMIAFGMKAGFIPFHIWLPLAHPVAPSHVSAMMSGIMIKMGIYGILRAMLFITPYHSWWGITLILLGSLSGILGVLFAIGQRDMKRLLAYSSVENIGIILLGIGIGILGMTYHHPIVATLGFAGALLHVINHSIFKALLFLGAGAVIRQTGTGKIDALGGLIKKMPWTAGLFLMASLAITGLPFFNGFISEILIYSAAITGSVNGTETLFTVMSAVIVVSLATIGGLAGACFTKVFGTVFLGLTRDESIKSITEVPALMKIGMSFLGVLILLIGMFSFIIIPFLKQPLHQLTSLDIDSFLSPIVSITSTLSIYLGAALMLIVTISLVRFIFFRRQTVLNAETWGCGYTRPETSMQYTASSFAEPITTTFSTILASHTEKEFSKDPFPQKRWKLSAHVNDWVLNKIFIPLVKFVDKLLNLFRWIQCGKAGVYVLYMIVTLLTLIIWMFLKWK